MSLLSLIVLLVIVGAILWVVNTYVPMDATIKKLVNIVVIIVVCIYLLQLFGILPDLNAIRVGG